MRVNRLLEITTLLLKGETIPAREFAQRFDVSLRTIYRDVEVLSGAGIPVYMTQGKGGGISLLNTYQIDRAILSEGERNNLLMALKTLQATQFPEVGQFLARLEALFHSNEDNDWVWIEFSEWGSQPDAENRFTIIKHAILKQYIITFDYIDARGERSHRQLEPMQLIFKSQAWYLWGYCLDKQELRTFRLSRMRKTECSEQTFVRRPVTEIPQLSQTPAIPFSLLFAPQALQRVYDDFNDQLVTQNSDGTCLVNVNLVEDEWVYSFLLSYGCYVEVIEPVHVRSLLVERMQRAIQKYQEKQ
jgi:predicted DNA-binding transcriptional regulator YafY